MTRVKILIVFFPPFRSWQWQVRPLVEARRVLTVNFPIGTVCCNTSIVSSSLLVAMMCSCWSLHFVPQCYSWEKDDKLILKNWSNISEFPTERKRKKETENMNCNLYEQIKGNTSHFSFCSLKSIIFHWLFHDAYHILA